MRHLTRLLVAVVAAAAIAACSADEPPAVTVQPGGPFEACPAGAASDPGAPSATVAGQAIPNVTLACFAGGQMVNVARLGRPAVINLWASWCQPCRAELPEFQHFSDAVGERVVVLGIVTGDTRTAAAAAAEDFGITFPALFDPDEALRRGLGRAGLPITLFVDADGYVRFVYQASAILTQSTLDELTSKHLGVVVR